MELLTLNKKFTGAYNPKLKELSMKNELSQFEPLGTGR